MYQSPSLCTSMYVCIYLHPCIPVYGCKCSWQCGLQPEKRSECRLCSIQWEGKICLRLVDPSRRSPHTRDGAGRRQSPCCVVVSCLPQKGLCLLERVYWQQLLPVQRFHSDAEHLALVRSLTAYSEAMQRCRLLHEWRSLGLRTIQEVMVSLCSLCCAVPAHLYVHWHPQKTRLGWLQYASSTTER